MLQQAAAPVPPVTAQPAPAPPAAVQAVAPVVAAAPAPASGNELLQVKNVYILPMGSSFDQFLANRLTRGGVLQVVTDAAKADAILTDRIGKGLEAKLEELYPDPAKKAAAEALAAKEKDKEDDRESDRPMQIHSNPVERSSSGGRAKGTLFLVHRGSRNVIWSVYEAPKSTRPNDLDDAAAAVVNNLASAIGKEAKAAGATTGAKKSGWKPW
ncbi:MAG TPA: hypothetical protein VGK29_16500 [Paludibaculum sp.]